MFPGCSAFHGQALFTDQDTQPTDTAGVTHVHPPICNSTQAREKTRNALEVTSSLWVRPSMVTDVF